MVDIMCQYRTLWTTVKDRRKPWRELARAICQGGLAIDNCANACLDFGNPNTADLSAFITGLVDRRTKMRVGLFLIVALIALSLPCMELPELAGMYNDASNDFFVLPLRAARPVSSAGVWAPRFAGASVNLLGVRINLQSPLPCAPTPHGARLTLNLISAQKK